ncbi:MAG: bifunctional 5,10-methylenetetrahydrofolate dehydrogenase/5,10-methenyltetrahydrofolate cyclohydrolase [Lachnospiraceae bacterium]|nr:bifunctional 5,10-methylenetetrahydrofolate dehydrogenase/5,10-methenyltetrahydrofolate cyclohydrolase [Lachnospiraceae bacterium]
MAKQLLGKEVNEALIAKISGQVASLNEKGVTPKLGIIRVGERPDDISYETGASKRCETLGVAVEKFLLPEDVTKEALLEVIDKVNKDDSIHGVLMFRPLPAHLRAVQSEIENALDAAKDVDCMTHMSLAGVFEGKPLGFPPCTPQACMEILDFYGIDCTGKKAVVIGRSLVVGKPAAMMLMGKNATVTVCHTKTVNVEEVAKEADILISCAGVLKSLTKDFVRPGQIVIDVSINWDPEKINKKGGKGAIAGDAVFEEVEPIVDAITPVPGGVGAVTTSVLVGHVVEAAMRKFA